MSEFPLRINSSKCVIAQGTCIAAILSAFAAVNFPLDLVRKSCINSNFIINSQPHVINKFSDDVLLWSFVFDAVSVVQIRRGGDCSRSTGWGAPFAGDSDGERHHNMRYTHDYMICSYICCLLFFCCNLTDINLFKYWHLCMFALLYDIHVS